MPWLLGTALLHSSLILERRGALISWTILLAILTLSLSLVGTFPARSGVLTSVHAFALDARRGVYILAIIAALTGSALTLFAARAGAMRTGALFLPLSREGGVTLNNLFLLAVTSLVFLGTFYPVFVSVLHGEAIPRRTALLSIADLRPAVHASLLLALRRRPAAQLETRRGGLTTCGALLWPGALAGAHLNRCGCVGRRRPPSGCARSGAWRLADRRGGHRTSARRWRFGDTSHSEISLG